MNDHPRYRDPDAVHYIKHGDLLWDFPDLLLTIKQRSGESSWSKGAVDGKSILPGWVMAFGYRTGGLFALPSAANDP